MAKEGTYTLVVYTEYEGVKYGQKVKAQIKRP